MAPPSPPPGSSSPQDGGYPPWLIFVLGVLITAIIMGSGLLFVRWPDPPPIKIQPPPTPAPTPTSTPAPTPSPLIIFVSGAVLYPGNYELPWGARVADALAAAGGFATDANASAVNQAEKLRDGAQVHVPSKADTAAADPPAGLSGGSRAMELGEGGVEGDRININTASTMELETLPNIGPDKAKLIIEKRPYSSVEDLERVSGIGPKTVEALRDRIVTQ